MITTWSMSALTKWIIIILLLVGSALAPIVIVTRDAIGREGYAVWVMLVIYAYLPAMVTKRRAAWLWAVATLCVLCVAAFAISLIKQIRTPEFETWISLAGWANLLSWALAIGSWFAGRFGRIDISGFALRRVILGSTLTRHDRSSHRSTG